MATLLKRQGEICRHKWMQLFLVRDSFVRLVDLVPAQLGGWKFRSMEDQGEEFWSGMSEAAIVAFKLSDTDDCDCPCGQDLELMAKIESLAVGKQHLDE